MYRPSQVKSGNGNWISSLTEHATYIILPLILGHLNHFSLTHITYYSKVSKNFIKGYPIELLCVEADMIKLIFTKLQFGLAELPRD